MSSTAIRWFLLCFGMLCLGFSWGYHIAYHKRAADMRDAIMCVMGSMSGEEFARDAAKYCEGIGIEMNRAMQKAFSSQPKEQT